MAYKQGRSEANSPTYREGRADGERDTQLMSECPGKPPIGPDPDQGWMYKRGYRETFRWGFHIPCDGCKQAS